MPGLALALGPEGRAPGEPTSEIAARARALVLEHFDFVWRLLRRLGVPEADADDAAQQVFIVAVERLAEISKESEYSFLYGTSLRIGATLCRNLRRRARWVEPGHAEGISDTPSPEEELERREAIAWLDHLLNGLSEELRQVFVLCEIEGLTAVRTGELVGIPAGTVASRLRRARAAFQKRLQRLLAEEARR